MDGGAESSLREGNVESNRLADLIREHTRNEGVTETPLEALVLTRISAPTVKIPVVYGPSLCVVAQGAKRAHLGERSYTYDANHYLLCSLTLPVESELPWATPESPFLGAVLRIDTHLVGQILLEMEDFMHWPEAAGEPVIVAGPVTEHLRRSIVRLLQTLEDPMDRAVLAPGLIREALYEVLRGPHGRLLRDCVLRNGSANRVSRVIRFLEENYRRPLDIDEIAKHAGMSASALHHHFRQATAMSPIQFVKKLRLHRARAMLIAGHPAGEAASEVGYTSPSQFSREFRRFFGLAPHQVRPSV